jgi:endonuclease YncB( thermonuclease family)
MRPIERRQLATANYLRRRRHRRLIASFFFALFVASVVFAHIRSVDDWSRFNHQAFSVVDAISGDQLVVDCGGNHFETVQLLGIVAPTEDAGSPACRQLSTLAYGHRATLLLAVPQTRDAAGHLLAYVYVDGTNLGVSLTAAGLVYSDRRQTCIMDGLIDPAEAEARRKKRGMWQDLKFEQMPPWRQAWLRGFSQQIGKHH